MSRDIWHRNTVAQRVFHIGHLSRRSWFERQLIPPVTFAALKGTVPRAGVHALELKL